MPVVAKLDELGKPAWIALMILGFLIWWPLGLATLAFIAGSGRMSSAGSMTRWYGVADRMRSAGTWWQPSPRQSGAAQPPAAPLRFAGGGKVVAVSASGHTSSDRLRDLNAAKRESPMWTLLGVVVVVVGFVIRLNPLLVIGAAALVTGIAAGLDPLSILRAFGKAFNESRYVSAVWLVT